MHALGLLDGVADAEVNGFLLALVVGNFSGDVLEGASLRRRPARARSRAGGRSLRWSRAPSVDGRRMLWPSQALGNYTREAVRTCCQRIALVEFVAGRRLLSGETDDGGVVLELLVARVEHRSVNLADRVGSGAVV
jgi:hypothetical protein